MRKILCNKKCKNHFELPKFLKPSLYLIIFHSNFLAIEFSPRCLKHKKVLYSKSILKCFKKLPTINSSRSLNQNFNNSNTTSDKNHVPFFHSLKNRIRFIIPLTRKKLPNHETITLPARKVETAKRGCQNYEN